MISQRTLDLLDAELRSENRRYQDYPYKDRYKLFNHEIRIDPWWSSSKYDEIQAFGLRWEGPYHYCSLPQFDEIIESDSIGIYVMYVQPRETILEMPKFVMYVGISGERGSGRPLKDRLADYFNIGKIKLRDNIHQFLQMYYEDVKISYALFDGDSNELERLEVLLHEFFNPKFASRDFEPNTKASKKAWNH